MSEHELRELWKIVFKFFDAERGWRDRVFPEAHPDRRRKLAQLEMALQAATRIKDYAKLHTEESPEQVELLGAPAVMRKGGY